MKNNKEREFLNNHINLKVTNLMFMTIDTLRAEYLKENDILPSRSEMIRLLLEQGISKHVLNEND